MKFAEDYGEVVNAPAGLFASEFDGVLVANGSDKVESEMAHNGHVECAVAFSEPRLVVVEDDIEGPVQSVLDQPVAAGTVALTEHETSKGRRTDFHAADDMAIWLQIAMEASRSSRCCAAVMGVGAWIIIKGLPIGGALVHGSLLRICR